MKQKVHKVFSSYVAN